MAAKPLDPLLIEDIITDWRLGQLSQRQIAEKRGVSNGVVAKLTKGVARDVSGIVSAGIQYQQALHTHDERIVSAVEAVVSEASKRMEWLNKAALKNVQEAMTHKCENQNDYRARADTISKAKEVVVGKSPDTAIQINNTNESVKTHTPDQFREIAIKVINDY
ncbi:MAG: hypothetical protein ACYC4K_03920 [Thiobacillus sp.]